MRRIHLISLVLLFALACNSTKQENTSHLIKDRTYRKQVETKFKERLEIAQNRKTELFEVFDRKLSVQEEEAIKFLYAYMPLNDLADYNSEFFLDIVKVTLKAKREMLWGPKIPEDVFRHFVLPYRINNENLDTFRIAVYPILKERIKGMKLKEAILEINHWCHEKVAYKATDIRTSAPLSTIKTSWGRCGEESTFTVSALRAAGIPARQCYTPRWAHTDDNHAWVEVWVDGKWYFLGACEPEPDLNMGWFKEPVRRAMLVHTKTFGAYKGTERVVSEKGYYSELNLLDHYAKTKEISIKVLNENKKAVENALVELKLYNYSEFYPIIKKYTNEEGRITGKTGFGDLIVWASKDGKFGFKKISGETINEVTVVLDKNTDKDYSIDMDIEPPIKYPAFPAIEKGVAENNKRLKEEDKIRNEYMATFMNEEKATKLAEETGFNADSVRTFIKLSQGNWAEIEKFLRSADKNKSWTLQLLAQISKKDLRDSKTSILLDHLNNFNRYINASTLSDTKLVADYILNPRIANEMLTGYRKFLQKKLGENLIANIKADPKVLEKWIVDNIKIKDKANYYRVPISPQGVYDLKISDYESRDFFFVAACRSAGIAARFNMASRLPQYYDGEKWIDVLFDRSLPGNLPKGTVAFVNNSKSIIPKYYVNFTIAEFYKGRYETLEFEWNLPFNKFSEKTELNEGKYMLVTGNRMSSGAVLTKITFFSIKAGEHKILDITPREDMQKLKSQGKLNMNLTAKGFTDKKTVSLKELAGDKGIVMVWLDPDKEPGKHVMADIPIMDSIYNKWGGSFAFMLLEDKLNSSFTVDKFKNLPKESSYFIDTDKTVIKETEKIKGRGLQNELPIILIVTAEGDIVFFSEGYTIGIGEHIAKLLMRL